MAGTLLFAAFQPCYAQTDPAKPAASQTTVVNVNEVSLNLVVRSKSGKLVSDLKPEDITVTDGGVPVKISTLHLVTGDSGDHLLTFVFDRLDSAAMHNAREIAGKILKTVPPSGFSFCVMKVQARLMLYQDFTSDRKSLEEAVRQVTAEDEPAPGTGAEAAEKQLISIVKTGSSEPGKQVTAKERSTARVVLASLEESQRIMQELHTQPGLAGLLALARTQQRMSGRKTVIYFSQGLQSDTSAGQRLQEVIGAANRAGVSIYVVDTNALAADQSMVAMMAIGNARSASAQAAPAPTTTGAGAGTQTVAQPPPGLAPMVGNQLDRFEGADPNATKNPLGALADSTGGSYVAAGEDIKKPLRRLIEDMTTYYEASYVPPIENFDGQFRPIAVTPVRKGLKINSRAGYFALPPDAGRTIRPFEAPLLKAFGEPQLPSQLDFHAKVLRLGELQSVNENTLVVEVPVSALETRDDPNTNLYSLHVSIVAQIKDKSGAVLEHFSEDIPRHGALGSQNSEKAGFITMQRHFTAEPGEYSLEAAILDQYSGKIAAQRLPFEIASTADGPSLSDVTMVQRVEPEPDEADPAEPMRYGGGKVVPSIAEQVGKGTKELSFFFIVHSNDAAEQPRLEMEILKSGESIAQVPLNLRKTNGAAAVPYMASIQSSRLPSGDYEVIEKLTQGEKIVERKLAFRIEGPEPTLAALAKAGKGSETDDAEPVSLSGLQLPEADAPGARSLTITTLPDSAVTTPTSDQLHAFVEDARKRAIGYSKALPNFLCIEITNRSVDSTGSGKWKHRDSIAELLSYRDHAETRTTLEVNGKRSTLTRAELNSSWPLSVGEFGAILNLVFQPASKTEFQWKEAASLGDGGGTLQVLSYRVTPQNATIVLSEGNDEAGVGFHGLVYIDPSTGGVRRVTLEADGLPKSFAVRAAGMSVDYEYVAISGRDYLLPVHSTVTLGKRHKKIELNEISFRNYRRFASRAKIRMVQ